MVYEFDLKTKMYVSAENKNKAWEEVDRLRRKYNMDVAYLGCNIIVGHDDEYAEVKINDL